MAKISKLSFEDVDEFLDYLPAAEREVTLYLREVIRETLPQCIEKLSYNVPYYSCRRRICFIWPASIPWGNVSNGVSLGFCYGHLIHDDHQYLENHKRKYVRTKTFRTLEGINLDLLQYYLYQAHLVDEQS